MLDDMEPFNEQSAIGAANTAASAYEDFQRTRDGWSSAPHLENVPQQRASS
jgi:hypothetical protein